jgi:AraC family transcriptional regulator
MTWGILQHRSASVTFWPDTRFPALSTDAMIASSSAYGISPGPAGYSIADLHCVPPRSGHSAGGTYSEACVALVLSGAFLYQSEGRSAVTVPGALVFANKHETFSCHHQSDDGNRRIVVFFSEKFLEPIVEELRCGTPRFPAASAPPSRMTAMVSGLLMRIARQAADSYEAALAIAQLSLGCRSGRLRYERGSAADTRRVLDVVRYINANFAEPCSLDALASIANMSRFGLARRFRAVTGETANQYVVHRRLSAAAARLAATARPISEIAYDVGFNDLSHFNACFRSAFGCPPSAWRRH